MFFKGVSFFPRVGVGISGPGSFLGVGISDPWSLPVGVGIRGGEGRYTQGIGIPNTFPQY